MACAAASSLKGKETTEQRKSDAILCRYFIHGVCRFGGNCKFSHVRTDRPNYVCTYYQKGNCAYGKRCRYDHVKMKEDVETEVKPDPQKLRDNSMSFTSHDESWVNASEFVPGKSYSPRVTATYSSVVKPQTSIHTEETVDSADSETIEELCPYFMVGDCRYGENCVYLHGVMCDMCGLRILHPTDIQQQSKHQEECLESHEEDMKESFKVAQSCQVSCGICMEVVWEKKEKRERKFGILENCSHAFCLDCIRKWRSAKSFNHTVVKACPECRVSSSFVTPSDVWVSDPEEKKKIIDGYKEHLSKKPCKHFDQGRGKCPFGAHCFYLHAYADGTKQDRTKIPKRVRNSRGQWKSLDSSSLWDFIEERDNSLDFDEDSLDLFDLIYLLGADANLTGDDDEFDWFFARPDSDNDSDFWPDDPSHCL